MRPIDCRKKTSVYFVQSIFDTCFQRLYVPGLLINASELFFSAGAACLKHAYNFIQAQKVIYVVFGLNAGFKTPDIFFT